MTKTMKCHCGGTMAVKRENFLLDKDAGLPVTLSGIEVGTCPVCGARDPIFPRMAEMNAAIVSAIARKKGRLAGEEVRFLRSVMGLSGREMAGLVGARPETVSRWESGAAAVGAQADKLLRLIAAVAQGDTAYGVKEVAVAASEDGSAAPIRVTLAFGRGGWKVSGEEGSIGRRRAA